MKTIGGDRSVGSAFAMLAFAACSSATNPDDPDASLATSDAAPAIDAASADLDGDGLDDPYELALAEAYLPFISLDPADGCSRSGLLVRVRPHPNDASKIVIVYDHLFERDCGFNGHVGDNEAFGVTIDPAVPGPTGLLAIKTASHQNTPCERVTECSRCGDSRPACDRAAWTGSMWPVLYASKNKHGQYATRSSCGLGTCLDSCTLHATPTRPPITNAGEPAKSMVSDLTGEGFITAANGWTEPTLMGFDPWGSDDFGSAGNVADDLVDPTFVPALCP